MRSSSASTLAWRSTRPRCCASMPSKSRFNAAVGGATDSVPDCEAGTQEPAQEDAAAMVTEGVEDWAESEHKGLFGYATGSRCRWLLPCQCVRVRARACVCVRVFSSGLFLYFKSFKSLKVYKVSLPEIPAGILVFGFQFFSFPYKTKTTTRPRLQRYFLGNEQDQSTSSEGETTVALDWLFDIRNPFWRNIVRFWKSYFCSNKLDVQETNCCFSQLNRI